MAVANNHRIGIDLGGTKIEVVVLDAANKTILRRRQPTPRGKYQDTMDTIADMVFQAERDLEFSGKVGICMPGSFSRATGLVRNANSTWLNGRDFRHDLSQRLNREVRFANDADCFALSEAVDGAAVGASIVFGVILGTGVGGGIVVRGKLLDGCNAIAGEWGHNPLPWLDPDKDILRPCYCGKKACIETFLSGPSMSWHHAELFGEQLSAQEISEKARQQNSDCLHSLAVYSDRLARGLASIINVLDPHVVVLGGGISNIDQVYRETAALLPRYVFSDSSQTQIKSPMHGDSGGVRGAAMLWDAE